MSSEQEYFERRAEAQIELAQKATNGRAVQAHYQLASAYLDKIYGDGEDGEEAA
jgi:hypothetical protein